MQVRRERESGFTLVELIIAMAVTLVVTGAIYGLLSGGQSAFRREPELTDRQQNIRLAMDMIMRDVASAGTSMPPFIQTFTTNLDGASIGTCVNNAGTTVTCPLSPYVAATKTDELEIMANPNSYDEEQSCAYPGGSSSNVFLAATTTRVTANMIVMITMADGTWTLRNINGGVNVNSGGGGGNCTGSHENVQFTNGGDNTGYNLASGLCAGDKVWDATNTYCIGCKDGTKWLPGTACCSGEQPFPSATDPSLYCKAKSIVLGEIVRYRIRNGADGVPNLERFSSGTSANFGAGGAQQFQVIARGIDDLQVTYERGDGAPSFNAPVVDTRQLDYNTITRRVSVTLSSRAEGRNLAGSQTVASGPALVRGTLTSSESPRSALVVLNTPIANRKSGWTGPTPWQ
jgi:prepilin-type N-terminal cleavage/methylation domain-containing protein